MRFSIGLPTDKLQYGDEFVGQRAITEMARAAEDAGFDACHVTDHPFPSDRWMRAGGHHAHDPFVSLAFAAAVTTTLRLHTNIVVLPYRNPFLLARSVSSLDSLSDGRVILGAAVGYQKAEFKALGVDFDARNELTDEAILALKAAWTQDVTEFKGSSFEALGNVMLPKPVQKPHPPIWIGGNSRRAIRRAVEHGDGWLPFLSPAVLSRTSRTAQLDSLEELSRRIDYMKEHAHQVGRSDPLDIAFTPLTSYLTGGDFRASEVLDEIPALAELGVTWLVVGVPCTSRSEFVEGARNFGTEVIRRTR